MGGADDWLPLSGIQHFCFCRRQWALIHLEQQWAENRRTVEGQLDHARCHDANQTERRGGLLITRGMQVVSRRLGLSGNCDVVEFRADPEGIPLQSTEGFWKPMPVEYKHGRAKASDADRLQLCAQAIALEEMLVCGIPEGALFYEETRRREVVPLTEELRQTTQKMADEMHAYFARGYTPKSIRNFCERVGVAKSPNTIPYAFLEFCLREDLNETAQRVMAVLKPVKLTITNYPEGKSEMVTVENNPNRPEDGTREVSFSRHLWIEQDDFLAEPIPKYKRLYPNGPECRLKGAYLITCTGCVKDENGNVVEILATYDPESRGGDPADGRKVKGATIHWVDAENCCDAEVRQYDNLFNDPDPDAAGKDFLACLNDKSLEVLTGCKVEASLRDAKAPASYQFMRLGYFCPDSKDCAPGHLVFNRSVSLKDSFKPGK